VGFLDVFYVVEKLNCGIRSVMPFDVLGCTRATMTMSASFLAWAKALANLRNVVVLWIVDCNYST
jgi:hypothetical protein